jgi:glutaminyl-tRNA synthetase
MISVTRRGNENVIGMHVLEHCIRKDLDVKAPRTMVVLDPVLVTITNVPVDFSEEISVNLYPKNPEKGNRKIYLQKELYVERSDIRLDDHADFWGIAPGRTIGLKYSGSFKVVAILQDTNGTYYQDFRKCK